MSVYLGLDASTQSLTATLIEVDAGRRTLLLEHSLPFDAEFPQFGTRNGVLRGADPAVVSAPPLLWVSALDRMMAWLVAEHPRPMRALAAISGSAQQHGSVYLNDGGVARLADLDPATPLADQLGDAFSRPL